MARRQVARRRPGAKASVTIMIVNISRIYIYKGTHMTRVKGYAMDIGQILHFSAPTLVVINTDFMYFCIYYCLIKCW